ncbi:MAG: ATP-binding protein [Candidatus Bathyarchaeia archaeon]|nr:ATP-binding protein [Candidatus Bathyarchaeota archaeon A05DMB-4]MDH7595885.1 ATP-binding protein [Candidatus Bathyarchaeota archaeon]
MNKNSNVFFGQIVKITSGERNFYARVVNARSSSTLETGEQLREAQGKETFGPYSSYKSIEAILFLEKHKGRIRSPTFNPNYMDKVIDTSSVDCSELRLEGELEIGRLRSGETVLGSVGINIDAIPYMMGMFGMTGSGKTNSELVLNAQIIDHSPMTVGVIFDFAGQLLEGKGIKPQKGLRDHPSFHTKVNYYSTKEDKMKIGLYTLTPGKLQTLFPEIGYPQFRFAQKLYKVFGTEWIEKSLEIFAGGGYKELGNKAGYGNKSVIEALMMKLQHLSSDIYPPSNYNFVDSVIENVSKGVTCLIDISGLVAEEQHRIVTLTATNVAQYYKKLWETNNEAWQKLPTLLITLEEAHEFLDPTKPRTIFSDIALTYRKYRIGLNAVTPRPSKINFDVFAELWTKVIMKTELSHDRRYLTENTPYLEYSDTEIKMLDIGEALLISEPKIRFAVPIKATHYPEYLDNKEPTDYHLPSSHAHAQMDARLKQIRKATDQVIMP